MIGIDLGGGSIKLVRLEAEQILSQERIPRTRDDWLDQAVSELHRLAPDSDEPIGVGVAGLIEAGTLVWGPHIEGTSVEVERELAERLGRPVVVENDANCATFAEAQLGPGKGLGSVLGIMVGTGIGMGLVADGRIYRGRSFAGEAGHMTMVPSGGLACPCGRRGCWETLVSGWRLAQLWGGGRPGEASALSRAAEAGDRRARLILDDAGRALGAGIANLIALLDPDLVIVGGGVMVGAGDQLLARALVEIEGRLEGAEHRRPTPLVAGEFGFFAGAVGAALLAANPVDPVGL